MTEQKLWTPTFVALTGANFIAALALYLIVVKIIPFAAYAYDVPYGVAGFAVTTFSFSAMLTRVLLGRKIDEWGLKKSIVLGFILLSIAGGTVCYMLLVQLVF